MLSSRLGLPKDQFYQITKDVKLKISHNISAILLTLFLLVTGYVTGDEIPVAMSKSDDYSKHSEEFNKAGAALVENGSCSVDDLKEFGGFWRSSKNKSSYFMDCKGKRINYTLGEPLTAKALQGIGQSAATKQCRSAIASRTLHGKPKWNFFGHTTHLHANGRVRVTQGFTAKTGLGIKEDYTAVCLVMQSGEVEILSIE